MRPICILLFVISISASNSEAAQCKDGWTAFKDEVCLKSFVKLLSYDDAKDYCKQNNSTLVLANEEDTQLFLANFTKEHHDNLWLAAKYDDEIGDFIWEDGTRVNYSNWQGGYTGNRSRSRTCVEMIPELDTEGAGNQWAYAKCRKRNLVMCQRQLKWTLEDTISEVKKMRKQLEDATSDREKFRKQIEDASGEREKISRALEDANGDRDNLKLQIKSMQQQLETVTARVVPIGSIYVEYYSQPSPTTLWPSLKWDDISGTYAGLFFRVSGGGAESWGSIQVECSPRITKREFGWMKSVYPYNITLSLPSSGWSIHGHTGFYTHHVSDYSETARFYTDGCEVRPRNQAVRIWKRTA